jgi:tetratricopeptide (TPR) repeat protein
MSADQVQLKPLRSGLWPWAGLMLAFAAIWALITQFGFPGFFDPFWPNHSDVYIFVADAHDPHGVLASLSNERPVARLLLALAGLGGPQIVVASVCTAILANLVLTVAAVKKMLRIEWSPVFIGAAVLYAALFFAHPYQYVFAPFDTTAMLAYLFFISAVAALLYAAPVWVVAALFFFSCFSKETFIATACVLLAAIVFTRGWKGHVSSVVALVVAVVASLFWSFGRRSQFVGYGETYTVSLQPESVFDLWARYLTAGYNIGHAIALAAVFALVVGLSKDRLQKVIALSGLVAAGLLALLPYSVFPQRFFPGYSVEAAFLLFALVLAIAALPNNWSRAASFSAVALCLAAQPVLAKAAYADARWSIEQQQRQARLWRGLKDTFLAFKADDRRVLVTGINFPFSPFDHPLSLRALGVSADTQFFILDYAGQRSNVIGVKQVHYLPAKTSSLVSFDRVITIMPDGSVADPAIFEKLDPPLRDMALRYPAIGPSISQSSGGWHAYLVCGTSLMSYEAWADAERCLRSSLETSGPNPYPHFYLGLALERQGRRAEAMQALQKAAALDTPASNPAFVSERDRLAATLPN